MLFTQEEATIVACNRMLAPAQDTARSAPTSLHPKGTCLAVETDTADSASVNVPTVLTADQLGRIDILHNNVGTLARGAPEEASLECWNKVMNVSFTSMFLICKHVLPIMVASGRRSIVNVSVIMPGIMKTPMVAQTLRRGPTADKLAAMIKERDAASPAGRMGDAWTVAKAATFFARDESAHVTGRLLAVDGGVTLRLQTF